MRVSFPSVLVAIMVGDARISTIEYSFGSINASVLYSARLSDPSVVKAKRVADDFAIFREDIQIPTGFLALLLELTA